MGSCVRPTNPASTSHRGHSRTSMALLPASRSGPISGTWQSINGHSDHIGFYVARRAQLVPCSGLVDGFPGTAAGHLDLDATSFGGYWTHLGPSNWYIDAVLQGTHLSGSPSSIRGDDNNVIGTRLRGFDRGRLPDHAGVVADVRAADTGDLATHLVRQYVRISSRPSRSTAPTCSPGASARCCGGLLAAPARSGSPISRATCGGAPMASTPSRFNGVGVPTGRNGGTDARGRRWHHRQADPLRQRLRRRQLFDFGQRGDAHYPKGQCRPPRDVVRPAGRFSSWPLAIGHTAAMSPRSTISSPGGSGRYRPPP